MDAESRVDNRSQALMQQPSESVPSSNLEDEQEVIEEHDHIQGKSMLYATYNYYGKSVVVRLLVYRCIYTHT